MKSLVTSVADQKPEMHDHIAVAKLLEERTYLIEFTHAEILVIHASRVLMDGRSPWAKMLKRFDHAAKTILEQHPEYVK